VITYISKNMNQKSTDINAGELTTIESQEVTMLNNIAFGRPNKRANTQDGSTRVLWSHNLVYSADDVLMHNGFVQSDPLFVAPALTAKPEAFRLRSGSPALGRGLPAVALGTDLMGAPRLANGLVDLSAYQMTARK
jgi:hypothetical protein